MLLSVGTATLDTVEHPDGRSEDVPGGSALFAAAAAAAITEVRAVGPIGTDYPLHALEPLAGVGVHLEGLRVRPEPTQRWRARYTVDGDRETVFSDRTILRDFRPTLSSAEKAADAVLLGSTDPEVQSFTLGQLPTETCIGLDSMGHWIDTKRSLLIRMLGLVQVYFGSEAEVSALGGGVDQEASVRAMLQRGLEAVVIKRGPRGATLHGPDWVFDGAARPTTVVDPTGAGDAFAGAFMATLSVAGREGRDRPRETTFSAALEAGLDAGARATAGRSWEGLLQP